MQLGWIDFSKNERNKVLSVIHQLEEPAAVDELGLGAIRDGFADFFSGDINGPDSGEVFSYRAIYIERSRQW